MHNQTDNKTQVTAQIDDVSNDVKVTLSLEAFRKLNRSQELTYFLGCDLRKREINGLTPFYLPHILSYVDEDLSFVLAELKEKGMCGNF